MKSREEIDAEYDKFAAVASDGFDDPASEGVFEALAWVLGYTTSQPSESYGLNEDD